MSDVIVIVVLIVALFSAGCWEMYITRKYPVCKSCGRPYEHCKCEGEEA